MGYALEAITTHRERLNDLTAASLVCRALRDPAQTALLSHAFIRANGRAELLRDLLQRRPSTNRHARHIAWTIDTKRADPLVLADLIRTAQPSSLTLEGGFFYRTNSTAVRSLSSALYALHDLDSLSYGGFDLSPVSSDPISHHLCSWSKLRRLELRQVRWHSALPHMSDALVQLFASAKQDTFWRMYPPPSFNLVHIGITFVRPQSVNGNFGRRDSSDESEQISWMLWLLHNSAHSLRSLVLSDLGEALPRDAQSLLVSLSSKLTNLSITGYQGDELLADQLCASAHGLLSLTLGGLVSITLTDQRAWPVLATRDVVIDKRRLRYIEIQHMQLFERLQLEMALNEGLLPDLQQIVLANASHVHPEIHSLRRYCSSRGIILTLKR